MNERITCQECNNTACVIKQHCSSDWLDRIELKKFQIYHLAKDVIFREGGYVEGVYFIHHGHVKVILKGANNKEQIVRLAIKGHVLGHRGSGLDKYPVSAIACSDTLVCFINNDILYEAFMEIPKLTLHMMEFYSRELRKTEIRMKYLTQMSVNEKVAEALLYIKLIFGINQNDGTLNACLTRQGIADMTGIMPEQVSRTFGEFEKKKLIVKEGQSGIRLIDEHGLHEIVRKYGIEQYARQK